MLQPSQTKAAGSVCPALAALSSVVTARYVQNYAIFKREKSQYNIHGLRCRNMKGYVKVTCTEDKITTWSTHEKIAGTRCSDTFYCTTRRWVVVKNSCITVLS